MEKINKIKKKTLSPNDSKNENIRNFITSGEGNGNPLQYSCLGNPMDRGALRVTILGVAKESDTTEQLHNNMTFYLKDLCLFPFISCITQRVWHECCFESRGRGLLIFLVLYVFI